MTSVKEYGAFGDGVHDDTAAIQKALDSGEKEIHIPTGIYNISDTLKVHSDTTVIADKTAKIVMKSTVRRKRNDFLLSNSDPVGGNKNITVIGGIWDGNNQQDENAKPDLFDKTGYSGAVLNFVNIVGLTLRDIVVANSVTFYIRTSKLHNFTMEDISFVSDVRGKNQDGIHFGGDVKHGIVRNIRALSYGQTTDDMIALNADDSIERVENLDLVRDAIEDITFENIFAECCLTVIRMLSVTAPIHNIRFKNIYGGFYGNAINADAARYCRTPLFKEEDYPNGVGAISDIAIENFTAVPKDYYTMGSTASPRAALRFETGMDNFRISGFRYIADEDTAKRCLALKARNLVGSMITVDGESHTLSKKDDTLTVDSFTELYMNKKDL